LRFRYVASRVGRLRRSENVAEDQLGEGDLAIKLFSGRS